MKEISVEEYLVDQVENGCGGICEKHVSPGRVGAPDRLVTWPYGVMDLVETKAPDKTARRSQQRDHKRRAKRNIHVYLIDTRSKVNVYIEWRRVGSDPTFLWAPLE